MNAIPYYPEISYFYNCSLCGGWHLMDLDCPLSMAADDEYCPYCGRHCFCGRIW